VEKGEGRFNPRARVGRDFVPRNIIPVARAFQSTRPRGARRAQERDREIEQKVSIHAPAWGATYDGLITLFNFLGFNPRARVGRDIINDRLGNTYFEFQSTRPRGARRE